MKRVRPVSRSSLSLILVLKDDAVIMSRNHGRHGSLTRTSLRKSQADGENEDD